MTAQTCFPSDRPSRGAGAHVRRVRPDRLSLACRTAVEPGATGPYRPVVRLALPGGDLRAPDTTGLRDSLDAVHRSGSCLVLDLSAVASVDAAVVGVLLAADRWLRLTGGGVVLTEAQPRVARALGVAGAERLLAA